MTRRVVVEFATEEAAERFRQYVRGGYDVMAVNGLAQLFAQTPTENVAVVVDEQPLPADAMRSQLKVRIGTKTYEIQRTEYAAEFLGTDMDEQIDMLTRPVRELVYRHYNEWKEVSE